MSAVTQSTNETERYPLRDEAGDERPISEAVIDAVAAAEGVESSELTERLYDSIDPDALNHLYETATERGEHLRVTFTLGDYEVVVDNEETLLVREPTEQPSR